jgi:cell fate regulator YaaT (PSP1 superfamily)
MIDVVGVKFRAAGKIYYFDPAGFEVTTGDHVVVETARGLEFGTVALAPTKVNESEIVQPLKKLVRKADEKDIQRNEENQKKKAKAMQLCQEKIDRHNMDMKLVDVEYTFDNTKVIFYFTSEGRVDFRDLVKDLAGVFRMRIELRQIGVRDEAKMMGGIGHCGKGLCCHEWLSDFQPVSIKMAKVQNLSLNPTKISGICGRLMCCLNYENDVYLEMRKGMPDVGEKIRIPEGLAIVWDSNILENKVKARLIIEEANKENDVQGKLSTELYVYSKDDIRRLGKGNKVKIAEPEIKEEEIPEEIKELLKD